MSILRKYLLSSVYRSPDDDKGVDPEAARKAEIQKQRDAVKVTSVKIEDEPDEVEAKEEDKDDEQKEEGGEEEAEEEGDKKEEAEELANEKKLELKAEKKQERLEKKLARSEQDRRDLKKRMAALEARIAADPDKKLTEEDVETLAEKKALEKQLVKEYNAAADKLAEGAQKQLKMKNKDFDALVKETLKDLDTDGFPGEIVGALNEIDNGAIILAHLLKNPDELEEIFALKTRPVKLGGELERLSTKLSTPAKKKISQVPDPIEPMGGKAVASDRLNFLMGKKNKSQEEMSEYVQLRNADVARKKANGVHGLR